MDLGIFIELLAWSLFGFRRKSKKPIRVPVTHVVHNLNGSWQFYSGNYLTKIRFDNFNEAAEVDSTIKELENLPVGHSAKRDINDQHWIRFEKPAKN